MIVFTLIYLNLSTLFYCLPHPKIEFTCHLYFLLSHLNFHEARLFDHVELSLTWNQYTLIPFPFSFSFFFFLFFFFVSAHIIHTILVTESSNHSHNMLVTKKRVYYDDYLNIHWRKYFMWSEICIYFNLIFLIF